MIGTAHVPGFAPWSGTLKLPRAGAQERRRCLSTSGARDQRQVGTGTPDGAANGVARGVVGDDRVAGVERGGELGRGTSAGTGALILRCRAATRIYLKQFKDVAA